MHENPALLAHRKKRDTHRKRADKTRTANRNEDEEANFNTDDTSEIGALPPPKRATTYSFN
jgi:hypothetical protein